MRLSATTAMIVELIEVERKIMQEARNVLDGKMEMCCSDPMTGFYRKFGFKTPS